ncbi:MAG: SusC/RagA family TonB-linked outer membrane protein, partial [Bacteroidota bacterium]|nr:SusC/RagA family TonB-linked outer membrane protein [Bacteroidota bacterium]
ISVTPVTPGPTTIGGFGVAPGQIVDPGYLDRSAFEIMNRRGFLKDVRTNLNSSFGMNWDMSKAVTKGLSMKGMVSYDAYAGSTLEGGKTERLYLANINYDTDEMTYSTKRAEEGMLSIGRSAWTYYNINLQGSVNYSRKFGKHDVSGMMLAQRDFWDHGGEIPHNVIGLSGRAAYNYDSKYFAEFDMGYNGSEQFAPSRRFGFFPAFSASWVISNEQFLKDNQILTSLKVRASTGKVGNDRISSDRFLYLDNIQLGGGNLQSLGNVGNGGQEVYQGLIGNPSLQWEVAKKDNLGVDFQILKDLSGTFDYFKEHRTDILIARNTVPQFQGVDAGSIPRANMGIVDNHGYELDLSYNKAVTKDLTIMVKGNMGYNHNIVRYADEVQKDDSYIMRYWSTGYSIGQQRGYLIDWKSNGGYWVSQDEIKSSGLTYGFGSPRVGDFKYKDLNGDGVVDDKDIAPIGYSSIPRITWGATFAANYKGFDFTIFFQGIGKFSGTYGSNGVYENMCQGTYYDYHMNAWTLERYLNGEKITYPALSTVTTTNHVANDFFVMSRAFTRLKNMELGYTLPKSGLKALGINKLRVFVGGQNLYTWDNLRMGNLDPEYDNSIGYPITKMLNFGLNVTF